MSNQKVTPQAQAAYDTICKVFDRRGWSYEKREDLFIGVRVKGEHMPVEIRFTVDPEREALCVTSPLPFEIPEDKMAETTFAICAVMNTIFNGSYVYDISSGTVVFKTVTPFMGSAVSEEMVDYLINVTFVTVNSHNDMFLSLSKGMITIEQFLDTLSK